MKPEELRIGNWYLSTKFQTPVKCEMADIWEIYARAEGATPDHREVDSVFQPISLTPEWLDKFGFKKHLYTKNSDDECIYWEKGIWPKNMPEDMIEIENVSNSDQNPIWCIVLNQSSGSGHFMIANNTEHVHQLQNLYYALTGKEL
jgi:hypothetical protein